VDEIAIRAKQEEILAGQRQMQNVVIDHLLKEKEILSAEQAKKLIQSLCEQCRHEGGGMGSAKHLGLGRVLTDYLLVGAVDKEKLE
jgi:Spy/CpxP family protein refolding chaperone